MRRLIVIPVFLLALGTAFGQGINDKTTLFGVKGGLISSGTIYVEDAEFDTDLSVSLGGFLDYRLAPKLLGGLALDVHRMSTVDESKSLFNYGLTLKAIVSGERSRFVVRPGVVLGYGTVGAVAGTESSEYFTVGALVELIANTRNRRSWLGEVGIYGGPSGGNSDFDITFGPMVLIRGGLVF